MGGLIVFKDMVNCPECAGPISSGVVNVDGKQYHPRCFACKKCGLQLKVAAYRVVNRKFYCPSCVDHTPDLYHAWKGSSGQNNNSSSSSSGGGSNNASGNSSKKDKCIIL
eukprot:TRINITY_DN6456_c0_g1_i1.p1 TRINITY_DN6456_c0_g1~~TRINITY_DN6456_c0_g1_i1.p1  ORF type:complete len:110 (+),score=9.97 TRINITY_DN6456_c0_g1_i1:66-395(+)